MGLAEASLVSKMAFSCGRSFSPAGAWVVIECLTEKMEMLGQALSLISLTLQWIAFNRCLAFTYSIEDFITIEFICDSYYKPLLAFTTEILVLNLFHIRQRFLLRY